MQLLKVLKNQTSERDRGILLKLLKSEKLDLKKFNECNDISES